MDFSALLKPFINDKNQNFYIALSGGVDSVVLFNELTKLKKEIGFHLTAIHVNHNVQKDSHEWKDFCAEMCKENQIKFVSRTLRKKNKNISNLEKKLREERYKIFQNILDKDSILFMGHHLDDAIETFFLRALRGSGIDGLSSIPEQRSLGDGKLIRPFLNVSKSDLLLRAKKEKLKFIDDPSNKDNSFDRNYLRNIVLPRIEKRWPSYRKNLNQLTSNLKESSILINMQAERDFNEIKLKKNLISLEKLLRLSKVRQKNVFIFWINLNKLNSPNAKVINLFFEKFIKDEKTPKAKYIWGTPSKKGSVCIIKNSKELKISQLST